MDKVFNKFDTRRHLYYKYSALILSTILFLSTNLFTTSGYASRDPYDSGYDHGCDDARISDPSDRYINQPEKGPSFHTDEFMRGYDSGFNTCSSGGDSGRSYEPDGGGGSDGRSRGDLIDDVCDFAETNPALAAGAAVLLGYPGLDAAVRALCTFR